MVIHDVAEYVTWDIPRPSFYIDNILPKNGTMLVYGDPKVRKSWLVQHMAYCISLGIPWLGFSTQQARVLIAQFEIGAYAYQWRLKDMARNYSLQPLTLYEMTNPIMYLERDENYNSFMAEIRAANIVPNVIIFDCMSACYGGDENNGEQMAAFIERLSMVETAFDASLIIVHHANKNILNPNSTSRARGHTRLTGWVDTLMYMAEQPTGVQLQTKSRQSTADLHNLNIRFSGHDWHLV